MLQKDTNPTNPRRGLLKSKAFYICVIIVISIIIISVFALFIIPNLISITRDIFSDRPTKEEIIAYVNDNYESLEKFPYESLANYDWGEKAYIKRQLGKDTIVKDVYAYNKNILEFYCGGSGLSTGSTYEGFYLSRDDTPFAMDFDGVWLKEIDEGVFEWHNEDHSHRIYTEKIRDNWYYYIEDYY